MLEDVTPKWQSFEYVWANGLKRIVEHSWETPDEMHYYVLRNKIYLIYPAIFSLS